LPDEYAILRLPATLGFARLATLLDAASEHDLEHGEEVIATLHSANELSLVCTTTVELPADIVLERNAPWRALRVQGTLDFALTGILARLTDPLQAHGISVFAISSFNTDYLLVPSATLGNATSALAEAGWLLDNRP